jgi:hypothetical protein
MLREIPQRQALWLVPYEGVRLAHFILQTRCIASLPYFPIQPFLKTDVGYADDARAT